MADEKVASVPELSFAEPVTTQIDKIKSRAKRIGKYVISFGLLWFIFHRGLFPIVYHYVSVVRPSAHTHSCGHDNYAWAMDAFAPKEPEVPIGQLAENFFL
jgi:hypothetical protein